LKTSNIFPMKPSGVQLANATAAGLGHAQQLGSSNVGRGVNITPNMLTTNRTRSLRMGAPRRRLPRNRWASSLRRRGRGLIDEVGCDVDAADHAAATRSQDREIPRATRHVEHVRAGLERLEGLPRHEFLGDMFDGAGDLSEVAGFPGRFCLALTASRLGMVGDSR
jgi:hypothetical protein